MMVMMERFSWQDFWLACLAGNLLWYAVVLLFFYGRELSGLLGARGEGLVGSGGTFGGAGLPGGAKPQDPDRGDEPSGGLMGASRLPLGVQVVSSSQVCFSAGDEDSSYAQVGLVADVVQELKVIFAQLEKSDGGKPEFLKMIGKVREDYGGIAGFPGIGAINDFIRESAPFHISAEELDNLWY